MAVRSRLFAAIARVRIGAEAPLRRRRTRGVRIAAGAVLLIILGGVLILGWPAVHGRVDPMGALAEDHARATSEMHFASADPTAITRWLARQVPFAMHVPVLPGARLRGARLCVMDGRRGAAVEYDVNGVAVSYFVAPDGAPTGYPAGPLRFERTIRAGYHVVSWREPGLLHAMVGDLPASRLATLAEACIEQARHMVAGWAGEASGPGDLVDARRRDAGVRRLPRAPMSEGSEE